MKVIQTSTTAMIIALVANATNPAHAIFADWTSTDTSLGTATGTLSASTVNISNMFDSLGSAAVISSWDLSGSDFSFSPGETNQELIDFQTAHDWSASFSQPVNDLLLYAVFWRGLNGEINPVTYSFNHSFTVVSGFGGGDVAGNVLTVPETGLASGILKFAGPIPSLVVDTNSPSPNRQALTFGVVPEAAGLLLVTNGITCIAWRGHRRRS
jgi:hypothetical protein